MHSTQSQPITQLPQSTPANGVDISEAAEVKADLLDALSKEVVTLKEEARVLLKRRRELLTWRRNLLHDRS